MSEKQKVVKRAKQKNALELHKSNECGCSILANPSNCIYQQFLDGWSFTPDVGNGQKRGEVFTPRWVVDKMVSDVGMFPKDAVYEFNYETLSQNEKLAKISSKVVEPAVGTGNYITTVLWHKLQYAYSAALTADNTLNESEYQINFLNAVSSVYAFDIDCGNLETTKRRILGYDSTINSEYSVSTRTTKLNNSFKEPVSQSLVNIGAFVQLSLDEAFTNWHKFLEENPDGIVKKLYQEHTGKEIPEELMKICKTILDDNIKLFNGIKEDDVIEDSYFCPGYKNVYWLWWNFSYDDNGLIVSSFERVSLMAQILQSQIDELVVEADKFKSEYFVETDEGLFSTTEWISKSDERKHSKMLIKIIQLEEELEKFV